MATTLEVVRCAECDKPIGFATMGGPLPYVVCAECAEKADEAPVL